MDNVKFRGWTKEGKRVEGSYVVCDKIHYILPFEDAWDYIDEDNGISIFGGIRVLPETVGMFTGLKDKNGKEIYEWDIVQIDKDEFAVEFSGQPEIDVVELSLRTWLKHESMGYEGEALVSPYSTKIIGNIHDNSELMKESSSQTNE